jgi:hypothetical protein
MMQITRDMCRAVTPGPIRWGAELLQAGMGGCPWRVCIASMLCQRTRRICAEPVLQTVLEKWPTAAALARANVDNLEYILGPLGLQRTRGCRLIRFSSLYTGDGWKVLKQLPGAGVYVCDAVGLCCFRCTDLEGDDHALVAWANKVRDADRLPAANGIKYRAHFQPGAPQNIAKLNSIDVQSHPFGWRDMVRIFWPRVTLTPEQEREVEELWNKGELGFSSPNIHDEVHVTVHPDGLQKIREFLEADTPVVIESK